MRLPVFTALALLLAVSAWAGPYGQLGISLKVGESAGPFGAQLAYNFSPHWQAACGVGGAGIPYLLEYGNARTDSYFLMGKYYFQHLYLAVGYSQKRSRVELLVNNQVQSDESTAHGLPFHLGYEFGNRRGFFFSSSIGLLYVFKGGDRELTVGSGREISSITTASTNPSAGLTLGYYFDLRP